MALKVADCGPPTATAAALNYRGRMIDRYLVGALVRGDLTGYRFTTEDVRLILANRVGFDVQQLLAAGSGEATDEAAAMLDRAQRAAALRSIQLAGTANEVTRILRGAGVQALVYKGVAQSVELRGNLRGPLSADVDVLIAPESIDAAHEALVAGGLQRRDGNPKAPSRWYRFRVFETAYSGLPATIDLHWDVESPGYFNIPFAEMWSRRQHFTNDGLDIEAPSLAETLLITAVHGTREGWRSLRHILSFARLATMVDRQEWAEAERLSRRGAQRSLAVALGVAQACGVENLPARPGHWARGMVNYYFQPVDKALRDGSGPGQAIGTSPLAAAQRRLLRWRVAPGTAVGLDGFIRSAARQIAVGRRSWRVGETRAARASREHPKAN